MEQLIQIGTDFIEAQGMMAFVVVILAVLMYRDQTIRKEERKQQTEESKQQGEMLKILRAEVANNAALITKVDQVETNLINKAQSISDAATMPLIVSINEAIQTGNNIMETVTPLETTLREIRDELRQLREEVATRTDQIETRLVQVEKTATQETPKVEAPKPQSPDSSKEKTEEKKDDTNV